MPWSIFTDGGGDSQAIEWAVSLLAGIQAPITPGNVQFVYDWEKSEGGGGAYNPLNVGPDPSDPSLTTTGSQYGGGAADYAGWTEGLQGSVDYLNMSNYAAVKQALVNNDPASAAQALWASPWAASHYGNGSAWSTAALPGEPSAYAIGSYSSSGPTLTSSNAVEASSWWQKFLKIVGQGGSIPFGGTIAGGAENAATGGAGGLAGLGTAFSDLDKLIQTVMSPAFWIRALEVVGGAVAVGLGVVLLAKGVGVGGAVAGLAGALRFVPGPVGEAAAVAPRAPVRQLQRTRATQRTANAAHQRRLTEIRERHETRMTETEHRASARRYARNPRREPGPVF